MSYSIVIWGTGKRPVPHAFGHPLDALTAAIGYLKDGYSVRLASSTIAALTSADFSASVGSAARAARIAALLGSDQ